jgi:hypothetical protein
VEEITSFEGVVFSSFEEINQANSTHFEVLYFEAEGEDLDLCGKFTSHIPSLVPKEDNLELVKTVTEEEIFEALK